VIGAGNQYENIAKICLSRFSQLRLFLRGPFRHLECELIGLLVTQCCYRSYMFSSETKRL
jgi:hypothetical protein